VAVHGADVVVAAVPGADLFQLAQVRLGRRIVLGRELEVAVDSVSEILAPGKPDRVGA
jgi:hypothetical protein